MSSPKCALLQETSDPALQAVSKNTRPVEGFYPQIIDLMVQDHLTFDQAQASLGMDFTEAECNGHTRRKAFRELYRILLRAYYASKGSAEETDKAVIVGAMLDDAASLRVMGKRKEAGDLTEKAAGVLGLKGPETNINFWTEVTGSDLQRARDEIQELRRLAAAKPN